ncbi:MAG: HAD family hydrolase [Spirochaetes bacterium]|nr:HAD family hydrolase [Spirochaetota bacterium]
MTTLAFDIDGTIFDCTHIVAKAFSHGAEVFSAQHGIPLVHYSSEEIMRVVGLPTDAIFKILYPSLKDAQRRELVQKSQQALAEMVRNGEGALIEGAKETIEMLFNSGYRMCAASNGTREYIEAILETHGLSRFFLPLMVIDEKIKTKSDIVKYYMERSPAGELFIMIGDRKSDSDAARDNGIFFIGCAFGHMGLLEIGHEKWIAHRFCDIPGLVRQIEQCMHTKHAQ